MEPELSRNLAIVEGLRPIASRLGITVAQLALAWVLRLPEVTSAIAGARSPEQIRETAQAGDITLPVDAIAEVETVLATASSPA